MNNRPLTYNEGDIEYPVLKPNSMILGREATVLEENPEDGSRGYIKRCKDSTWRRWQRDYLIALRGKHDMKHKSNEKTIKVAEIVMVKEKKSKDVLGKLVESMSCL